MKQAMARRAFFCASLLVYCYMFILEANAEALHLDMSTAVTHALQGNSQVQAKAAQMDAAKAMLDASKASRLPRLSWQSSAIRSNSPMAVFGSTLSQQRITAADFAPASLNFPAAQSWYQHRLTLNMPLYRGGATTAAIAGREAGLNMRQHDWQGTRMQTIYAVYQAYSQALRAAQAKAVARQAKKAADAHVQRARHMLEKGMLLNSDVMDARVHQLNAGVAITQADHRYQQALDRLRQLLGLPMDQPLRLQDWQGVDSHRMAHPDDWWLAQALASRRDLQALQAQRDAAASASLLHKAAFRPQLDLQATEEWNNNTVSPRHSNYTVAAVVRWNLFAGGADQARLRAAEAQQTAAELAVRDLQERIAVEVRAALRQREETASRWQARRQALAQAKESLRIHRLRFAQGMENINSMLDAQTRLDAAAQAEVEARFDRAMADVQLLMVSGQLTAPQSTSAEEVQ